jgi:hypothetical protein
MYHRFTTNYHTASSHTVLAVVWLTRIASACIRRGYKPEKNQAAVKNSTQ